MDELTVGKFIGCPPVIALTCRWLRYTSMISSEGHGLEKLSWPIVERRGNKLLLL